MLLLSSYTIECCPLYYVKIGTLLHRLTVALSSPASGGQYSLNSTYWFSRVPHQEGHIAQLWHRGQELHVLRQAALVLEGSEVRLVYERVTHR